jgi:hypothetical protein
MRRVQDLRPSAEIKTSLTLGSGLVVQRQFDKPETPTIESAYKLRHVRPWHHSAKRILDTDGNILALGKTVPRRVWPQPKSPACGVIVGAGKLSKGRCIDGFPIVIFTYSMTDQNPTFWERSREAAPETPTECQSRWVPRFADLYGPGLAS